MQTHRFGIGERVAYTELQCRDFAWRGEYEIVSLLPVTRNEPEYRLRSTDPKYDRVASEHELTVSRSAKAGSSLTDALAVVEVTSETPGARHSDGR